MESKVGSVDKQMTAQGIYLTGGAGGSTTGSSP